MDTLTKLGKWKLNAKDIHAGIIARNLQPKTRRKSAKQQVKECREATINEAISMIKDEIRNVPNEWRRGYYSAITKLEMMK